MFENAKWVDEPLPGGYCLHCHRSDSAAGQYVEVGLVVGAVPVGGGEVQAEVPVYLCGIGFLELVRCAGEVVPLEQLVETGRRLTDANDRIVALDDEVRTTVARAVELEQQLQLTADDLRAAKVNLAELERQNAELRSNPATISRQALLAQVRAAATVNHGD